MPSDARKPPATADTGRFVAVCARAAGTGVAMASIFIFILATPPFAYGVWFQTEPVSVGLLVLGAAAGLCLLALDVTGHSVGLLLGRRHIQLFLAFLAWNALVSAVQDFPGRGWLGTPETGEGICSFLALLMLTLLATVLWSYRANRFALVAAAVAGACTLAGLDAMLPAGSAWRPDKYAGYAGLVGPPVALIVVSAMRRFGWRTLVLAVLAGWAPVAFSGNKTAIALLCLAGPAAFLLVRWLVRRVGVGRVRRYLAWLPVAALLLAWAAIAGAMAYGDFDPLYSVRSRGLLMLAEVLALRDHPLGLLTGSGWGSFNDALYRHTFLPGVHGFTNGAWDPNWEGVGAGAFHAHNDIVEAVLGGGLVGGMLYILFLSAIVAGARRGMLTIGAVGWFLIVGSLCFWYPFVLAYPFLGMAIAATTAPIGVLRAPAPVPMGGWTRGGGLALVVLLGIGASMAYGDAKAGGARLAALNRQDPADIAVLGAFPGDHGRGGVHLWWLALNEAAFVGQLLAAGHPPTAAQAQWFARLLQEVDAWHGAGRAGIRLEALTFALRTELIASHEHTALGALRERELPRWEPTMLRLIRDAPDRTDVAVPFLAFLTLTKQYSRTAATCRQIEALHPRDRVCQWYTGLAMLADPATELAGVRAMHAALQQRVETVVPITNAARAMVEANVPADRK